MNYKRSPVPTFIFRDLCMTGHENRSPCPPSNIPNSAFGIGKTAETPSHGRWLRGRGLKR